MKPFLFLLMLCLTVNAASPSFQQATNIAAQQALIATNAYNAIATNIARGESLLPKTNLVVWPSPDTAPALTLNGPLSFGGYTWATKPGANTNAGNVIFVSDVGQNPSGDVGSYWFARNSEWHPVGGQLVLWQSAVAIASANSTAEQFLYTNTLPAGIMTSNGAVSITTAWTFTNNGNTKTVQVRWNGVAGTVIVGPINAASRVSSAISAQPFVNRNNTASQVSRGAVTGVNTDALTTATVDTTAAVPIVYSVTKATGTDTATLEVITLILIAP